MGIEFCPLSADWGNWADWASVVVGGVAAAVTIRVAMLANATSQRATAIAEEATRIARQQHEEVVTRRLANARVLGRLLVHEISELPQNLFAIYHSLEVPLGWNVSSIFRQDVRELIGALRDGSRPFLPGAEKVEDRIHDLPEEISDQLATLIGYSRTLNDTSRRLIEQIETLGDAPLGLNPTPQLSSSFRQLRAQRRYIALMSSWAIPFANEFRNFAGVDVYDYSKFVLQED